MIAAIPKFAAAVLAEAVSVLAAVWSRAGRAVATLAAVGLGCLALVQCGEVRSLQKANGELWAERNALTEDLRTCRAGRDAALQSLNEQNAAVAALRDESARRIDQSAKALQQAQEGRQEAEARAKRLMAAPVGIDGCARAYSAMEAVKREIAR